MSERRTRLGMVAVGLAAWLVSIAFLKTWGIVASAVLVAWASYGLIVECARAERFVALL